MLLQKLTTDWSIKNINKLLLKQIDEELNNMTNLNPITLDFVGVLNLDTAGIAFIIYIVERITALGAKFTVINTPPSFLKFCQLYQLEIFML